MYNNLKQIYDRTRSDVWSMATVYLLDNGFADVQSITDEDIEGIKGTTFMTKEFSQMLVRLARDIAKECGNNVVEFIQFCQVEEPFDTKFYTPQKGMCMCKQCQEAVWSRGEKVKIIHKFDYFKDEPEECEWCGEEDECDKVEFL